MHIDIKCMCYVQLKNDPLKLLYLLQCSHEHSCPRFDTDDTPCNFEVSYFTPRIAQQSVIKQEYFSYIVIKKGW